MSELIKKFVFLLCLIVFVIDVSQVNAREIAKAHASPNIGRLYGKVVDSKTKKPVEFASVLLFSFDKDSLISGVLAKENGDFSLEKLPYGNFRLRIKNLGYKTVEMKVEIALPSKIDTDLGNIKLEANEELLKGIEVTAEKSAFEMNVDRKSYNVGKDLSSKGGTALDAMKNIPTITVDIDGNATLRDNNVEIYVDGRPTTLTLQQIPADQIDRIEVISNPSVKFTANTTGGILNIILKKNTKPGYNGTVMGNVGTVDRYGFMGNMSVKENPLNLSLMYSANSQINDNDGFTKSTDLENKIATGHYIQDNITRTKSMFQFGKISLDYNVNNRNTLTLSGSGVAGDFKTSDLQNFEYSNDNTSFGEGYRVNDSKSGFQNYTTQLLYRKIFPTAGKELTIDANHNYSSAANWYTFTTHNQDANGYDLPFSPEFQKNVGGGKSNQYIFQLDLINPKTEKSKIEMGIRSFYKNWLRFNNTSNYSYTTNSYDKDTIMSNNYVIDDVVNAAYISCSNYIPWNVGYQAGLRFEQTFYKGILTDKNQSFKYSYPGNLNTLHNSLFPAIYLSKKRGEKKEVQFNVSRKIERPNFFQTMPYVMFADKKNIRTGNPALKPEFISIAEVNYNQVFKNGNWLSALYSRYSEQPITNKIYPSLQDSTMLINTYVNGKSSLRYGMENTVKYVFFKKLTTTFNVDVFYVSLTSDIVNNEASTITKGWSDKGKLSVSYSFPWEITLQVNGTYEAPKVIINGKTLPVYFMDVSLNKAVGTKWAFNLTLNDVFDSKRMGTTLETDYYIQDLSRRRETRFLRFSLTYSFGKFDSSIFKRKGSKGGSRNMDGGDGLDF